VEAALEYMRMEIHVPNEQLSVDEYVEIHKFICSRTPTEDLAWWQAFDAFFYIRCYNFVV